MTTPTSTAARSPPRGLRRRVGLRGATFRPGRGAMNCRRLPPPMSPLPVRAPRDESTQEYVTRRSWAVPIRRSRAALISVLEGAEPSGRPARKASLEDAGPRMPSGRTWRRSGVGAQGRLRALGVHLFFSSLPRLLTILICKKSTFGPSTITCIQL